MRLLWLGAWALSACATFSVGTLDPEATRLRGHCLTADTHRISKGNYSKKRLLDGEPISEDAFRAAATAFAPSRLQAERSDGLQHTFDTALFTGTIGMVGSLAVLGPLGPGGSGAFVPCHGSACQQGALISLAVSAAVLFAASIVIKPDPHVDTGIAEAFNEASGCRTGQR